MADGTRLLQFASSYADVEIDTEIDENGETQQVQKVILAEPSCKVDQLMDDIKNGDYGVSKGGATTVALIHFWVQEFSGKISHYISSLDDKATDAYDAYLRLHLLSHRLVAPHGQIGRAHV